MWIYKFIGWKTETRLTWTGSLCLCGDNQRTARSRQTWPQGSPPSPFLWKSNNGFFSCQSIPTDDQTRWRRGSPSSQQRLKKSSDTIKHCLQWQYTECHNCLMHGNDCAGCREGIICIIKFHPNRRIDPISINSSWKWNWGLCFVCGCVFGVRLCVSNCLSAKKKKEKKEKRKRKNNNDVSFRSQHADVASSESKAIWS